MSDTPPHKSMINDRSESTVNKCISLLFATSSFYLVLYFLEGILIDVLPSVSISEPLGWFGVFICALSFLFWLIISVINAQKFLNYRVCSRYMKIRISSRE